MKIIIYTFSLVLLSVCAHGQAVQLNAYAGYVFDDKFDTYYTSTEYLEGKIKGGLMWGAGVEVRLKEYFGAELIYLHQDTDVPVSFYYNGVVNRTIDLGASFIMLGGVRYMTVRSGKAEPYGGLMLGMAIYNNKNPVDPAQETSMTKFAWGARLGTNIWMSDKVGIKLQAYLLSAVQSAGGGFYVGTGGAGTGVTSYSTIFQFGLGGGLIFKVKQY